jgi:predicted secreted hydrolase
VHLPADQAPHQGSQNEWWYVVGHMRSGSRTFGYEVTAFRFSHLQLPGAAEGTTPVTLYRTDVAITDETGKRFHQKVTYYFPQSVRLSSKTLDVHVGSVSLTGPSPQNMTLRASMPSGAISLRLHSRRPAMNVGGRGYLRFGGGFTYYYSLTDIGSTGTLTVGGKRYRVTGTSWLDHQWGNWSWRGTGGWTWMAIQLRNGVQFSVFDVRSNRGHTRAASVLLANGRLHTARDLQILSHGTWRSPHTGAVYPSGWTVRIPSLGSTLTVTPTVRDQELVAPAQPAGSYWEGSGRVTGTFGGKPVSGDSYTELTGYVRPH